MFLSVHPFFVVYRPSPNRIASATQSDCVRRPIRLRPPPDDLSIKIVAEAKDLRYFVVFTC